MERTSVNSEPVKTSLTGDGDFRSPEAIALLDQADIVVTNPPFSLFREYVAQLIEFEKDFLIIGNTNAITYKEVFKLIKENKLWLGISPRSMTFMTKDNLPKDVNACWFTNLSHSKRNQELFLYKSIHDTDAIYPKYDNFDAIEISKVKDLPKDYAGYMGVPITFLEKYNPNQFEIVGMSASAGYDREVVGIEKIGEMKDARPLIDGKNTYARIFIKNKAQK